MHYVILVWALVGLALLVESFLTKNDEMERVCRTWPNLSELDERLLP